VTRDDDDDYTLCAQTRTHTQNILTQTDHTHTHTNIHMHVYMHTHPPTHTHIHTYTHTYIHTYIHIYTHTGCFRRNLPYFGKMFLTV
jgi:hypothetical protein